MKIRARQQFELPSRVANIPFAVRICRNIKEKKIHTEFKKKKGIQAIIGVQEFHF